MEQIISINDLDDNEVKSMIDSKFFYFAIDEYIWKDDEGSDITELNDNYAKLLKTNIFKECQKIKKIHIHYQLRILISSILKQMQLILKIKYQYIKKQY